MKNGFGGISSGREQHRDKEKHTVADNVRQGYDWCWITGVLSKGSDKAERSRYSI